MVRRPQGSRSARLLARSAIRAPPHARLPVLPRRAAHQPERHDGRHAHRARLRRLRHQGATRGDAGAGHICTHDEIRSVLRSALADPQLRAIVADYLTMTTKAVIVDEVFDGNRIDLEIVRIAAEAGIPTTVIGDPWQALYEFRGAQPELVPGFVAALQFESFPVLESFRFRTDEMKALASELRAGNPVQLHPGAAVDAD